MSTKTAPVTIASGYTDSSGSSYGSQTNCARLSDGTLICAIVDLTNDDIEFHYSTDDGDNWTKCTTEDTSANSIPASQHDAPCIYIAEDDTIHYFCFFNDGTSEWAGWGFGSFTGSDMSLDNTLTRMDNTGTATRYWINGVAIEDPDNSSNWRAFQSHNDAFRWRFSEATAPKAGGSVTIKHDTQISTDTGSICHQIIVPDTGDARTPSSASPDMYIICNATGNTWKMVQITWNGTTKQYDLGTVYTMQTSYKYLYYSGYDALNSKFYAVVGSTIVVAAYYWANGATSGTLAATKSGIPSSPNRRLWAGGWHPVGLVFAVGNIAEPTGDGIGFHILDVSGGWSTGMSWESACVMGHDNTWITAWECAPVRQDYTADIGYLNMTGRLASGEVHKFWRLGAKWDYDWRAYAVAAVADDGRAYSAAVQNTNNPVTGSAGTDYWSWYRFLNVDVDETLNKCLFHNITVSTVGTASSVNTVFKFEDADNGTNPTSWTDLTSTKSYTTARTDWDPSTWPTIFYIQQWDVTTSAQEVIDRAGWAAGNNMMLTHQNDGTTGTNYYGALDYDVNDYGAWIYMDWAFATTDPPHWGILLQ